MVVNLLLDLAPISLVGFDVCWHVISVGYQDVLNQRVSKLSQPTITSPVRDPSESCHCTTPANLIQGRQRPLAGCFPEGLQDQYVS
jgi:hypothetical protein